MRPLEIGICSWSIDRENVIGAIERAAQDLDLCVVQAGFFGETAVAQADSEAIRIAAAERSVDLSGAFIGFDGEDYSTIAAIRRTGGFVPDADLNNRLSVLAGAAALTASVGLDTLAVHLGTIPEDRGDRRYAVMLDRVRRAADACAEHRVALLAESGTESPVALRGFIVALERENVGVNYDAGNFVTYGTGNPVEAVGVLGDLIRHVHVKDSAASSEPGVRWGAAMPLGAGDANIPRVISKLRARGYVGPLVIEGKAPGGVLDPIRKDIDYLRSMCG